MKRFDTQLKKEESEKIKTVQNQLEKEAQTQHYQNGETTENQTLKQDLTSDQKSYHNELILKDNLIKTQELKQLNEYKK